MKTEGDNGILARVPAEIIALVARAYLLAEDAIGFRMNLSERTTRTARPVGPTKLENGCAGSEAS